MRRERPFDRDNDALALCGVYVCIRLHCARRASLSVLMDIESLRAYTDGVYILLDSKVSKREREREL